MRRKKLILQLGIFLLVIFYMLSFQRKSSIVASHRSALLYAYYEGGYLYHRNFEFFIENGILEDDNVDYFIIVSGDKCTACDRLPPYSNIKLIKRTNVGYDFGAWADALRNHINIPHYEYFFLVNPSSRGPFVRKDYLLQKKHWTDIFTHKLQGDVHFMGPTISCEQKPHVQSYFIAMTNAALQLLLKNQVFPSPDDKRNFDETIVFSEVGSSQIILRNGSQIACLIKEYEGHDFRKGAPSFCNSAINPTIYWKTPGNRLDPYDVVFWKKHGIHKSPECKNVSIPCSLDPYVDQLSLKSK